MMVVMIIVKSKYCIYEKWKYKYLSQRENYLKSENKNWTIITMMCPFIWFSFNIVKYDQSCQAILQQVETPP